MTRININIISSFYFFSNFFRDTFGYFLSQFPHQGYCHSASLSDFLRFCLIPFETIYFFYLPSLTYFLSFLLSTTFRPRSFRL